LRSFDRKGTLRGQDAAQVMVGEGCNCAEFKFQVALEAAKGMKALDELSSQYGVQPDQISGWKRELLEGDATVFSSNSALQLKEQKALDTRRAASRRHHLLAAARLPANSRCAAGGPGA
jgi:transposase-like protein